MKAGTTRAAGRRLTREDWILAARKVLVTSGIDDVKVDRLARRMRMTRGSFYWHFEHRKDLLEALLSDWESRNYFEISQVRVQWAQHGVDLADVIVIWVAEEPGFPAFDMAIRVWARKSKSVAGAVHRVDDAWIQLLSEIFLENGYDSEESVVRARVAYYHQVGYYAIGVEENMAKRLQRLPLYYAALTGKPAPPDLIASTKRRMEKEGSKRKRRAVAVKGNIPAAADHEPAAPRKPPKRKVSKRVGTSGGASGGSNVPKMPSSRRSKQH